MFDPKFFSLIVFIISYLLFVFLPNFRMHTVLTGAFLLIITGTILPIEAFYSINWNVMGMFVGMLMVSDVFMQSKAPSYLAEIIANKAKSVSWAMIFLCVLTGFISVFIENVATILIVAPIAISLSKKLNFNPIKMMIAIAITSNLHGIATLIGDPTSMLLGGFTGMTFNDFFFFMGRPGIFWAVQASALASFVFLYFIFRKHKENVIFLCEEKVKSWMPTIMLCLLIVLLSLSSFLLFIPQAGTLCLIFGLLSLFWAKIVDNSPVFEGIKKLDWETTFFLIGVFILVGGLTSAGWITSLAVFLSSVIGDNALLGYLTIVISSVFLSAFVENVPYFLAMLPVVTSLSENMTVNPYLFFFGLLLGASIGGNVTPIGASANIAACGLLKKEGRQVSFLEFVKIGLPFTLIATTVSALFVWIIWR
ncbi:hypothetical protein A2230_05700 [candidate division WOR-1 bacterium RIFOXYA2_FULL_36_21]|uniref:Citrate transporter-like domain-containing protein n=1 Tax=candidate division WOR-1 bacterium RIFOXYB2_FULL_36_35 TaxID=1802578 RepID=A0A1F4S542_UNCSA|nr:MAG: hypothetical protein A2230_05700 [candidate division WOR-1 bacterium RIFOXYA2_FULL_36_21]OGC15107.1 MAG: hypothetical protein A2282_04665 [candidate division WOR-1 bacterium RIFOXYA12_FULL_36_13]OGC15548.1 MAG: hypothetical protein A2290_04095 [candidate division WOR-1 bacterium RIFOXYB2_FULL_36_35]